MANNGVLSTTAELMPLEAFLGLIWAFFALCTMLYAGRVWIRWVSLRKIHPEDYLMLFVLLLLLAATIVCQLRLTYVYEIEDVGNGLRAVPATFLDDVTKGLRGLLASQVLIAVALWGVKANFLIFFYRIFCAANRTYRLLWWGVVGVTVACFGVFMGLMSYECTASEVAVILTTCTQPWMIRLEWIQVQTTSAVDAFNDVLIIIFPIAILWKVRISLKRKLWLSFMFALSLLTVAMAIIRGTISYGRIASDYSESQNISWIWFWLQMELIVSFLVACMCSFQALFTTAQRKKHSSPKPTPPAVASPQGQQQPRTFGSSGKASSRRLWHLYDTLVDTCVELERGDGDGEAGQHNNKRLHGEAAEEEAGSAPRKSLDPSWDRLPLDSYCMNEPWAQGEQDVEQGRLDAGASPAEARHVGEYRAGQAV